MALGLKWINSRRFLLTSYCKYVYVPRKISGEHKAPSCPSVRHSVPPIRVRSITSLFEVRFENYFTEMTTMLKRRVARKI